MASEFNVVSPLPGIFYRKPAPDQPPYAEPGQRVESGQTIGLVELMKTFHELRAGATGVLRNFAVDNEAELAVGQTVAVIDQD
jgi:biotin carboxyl carrier protein